MDRPSERKTETYCVNTCTDGDQPASAGSTSHLIESVAIILFILFLWADDLGLSAL